MKWKPKAGDIVTVAQQEQEAALGIMKRFEVAVQAHIDATAKTKGYADGSALAGYYVSTIPQWYNEAVVFVAWRDLVWSNVFSELALVQNGTKPVPDVEEFILDLPPINWG